MSRISILQHIPLYKEDIRNYGGEDITFQRTPAMEMQYIQDSTKYAFADVQDTLSPIKQNLENLRAKKKAKGKFFWIPTLLMILGIASIVVLAVMDKSSDFFPVMQKIGIVGAFLAIASPFQYILVGALTNKPSKEFAQKLTAAQARMYLLTDGTMAILNDNYEDYAGEKMAFRGIMLPQSNEEQQQAYREYTKAMLSGEVLGADMRELNRSNTPVGNEQVFPFKNCVYINRISDIKEYPEKDSYEVTCSGVMYAIVRPFVGHHARRERPRRDVFFHYMKVEFSDKKIPLPKRYIDAEIYEGALNGLKK